MHPSCGDVQYHNQSSWGIGLIWSIYLVTFSRLVYNEISTYWFDGRQAMDTRHTLRIVITWDISAASSFPGSLPRLHRLGEGGDAV